MKNKPRGLWSKIYCGQIRLMDRLHVDKLDRFIELERLNVPESLKGRISDIWNKVGVISFVDQAFRNTNERIAKTNSCRAVRITLHLT